MTAGTKAVREALGLDVLNVTDKEIQDALWHYYYDIAKTVSYILNSRMPKKENVPKKKKGGELYDFHCLLHISNPGYHGLWHGEATRSKASGGSPVSIVIIET